MKILLKVEELFMMGISILLLFLVPSEIPFWLYPILFFVPDISMLGYLSGTKAGAVTYNLFHHKAVAIAVGLAGYFLHEPYVMISGIILFGHSSMDRVFGFGLKYADNFKHTHLGIMK